MFEIIYPVERLLANPKVFYAIANYLGGPNGDTLKDAFYDLLEHGIQNVEDPADAEFLAVEICFSIDSSDGTAQLTLDTGHAILMKPLEGEAKAQITNDHEMAATSAIYDRIVKAIIETNPDFDGNIALCSPPTPGNSYLRSEDGERFEGSFHLLTDPERRYAFNVDIIDVQRDILKASYNPIL